MGRFSLRISKHGPFGVASTPAKHSGSSSPPTHAKRSSLRGGQAHPALPFAPEASPPAYCAIDSDGNANSTPRLRSEPGDVAALLGERPGAITPFSASSSPEQAYAPYVPEQPASACIASSPRHTSPTSPRGSGSLCYQASPTSVRQQPSAPPAPGLSPPLVAHSPQPCTQHSSSGVTDTARRFSHRGGGGGTYAEDPLDLLKSFDTVLLVDDSGSMQLKSESGLTRWAEARDALAGLVALVKDRDPDGVDVHFLNSPQHLLSCTDPEAIRLLFDSVAPEGATPMAAKIEELMLEYLDAIELVKQCKALCKPLPDGLSEPRRRNYLVLTDGAASDEVEDVIVAIARRLDQSHFPLSQVGFSFVQVGDDAEASAFLEELDDTIASSQDVRDIVDTTPYHGMALSYDLIVKALLGGVNRRFDRRTN